MTRIRRHRAPGFTFTKGRFRLIQAIKFKAGGLLCDLSQSQQCVYIASCLAWLRPPSMVLDRGPAAT